MTAGRLLALVLLAPAAAACTDVSVGPEAGPSGSGATSPTPTVSPSSPPKSGGVSSPTASPSHGAVTLASYFDRLPRTSRIRLGGVRETTGSYTSYNVRYRSDGLRISGVLNVPHGRGPFPAVVLAHGWIDRDSYVRGQGMTRERGYLAERGYVALHVDYRNHAFSDDDPDLVRNLYRGYAVDVVGAVRALKRSDLPVDGDRIGLMGRSMGGNVVLQALEIAPGLAAAGIVYSGQSSLEAQNYARWGGPGSDYAQDFVDENGTPKQAPARWRAMSTRPYLDRITEPVLMIHGRFDDVCPPRWATATHRALRAAGVAAELNWYGDGHAFGPEFTRSMRDATGFLAQSMR